MGRKNVIKTHRIFDAQSIASTVTSDITNVINLDQASIFISWTGSSPVGVLTVEATNDDPSQNIPVATWRSLDFGSAINISGNSGSHDLIFNELPFAAIRIKYTATSGAGNLTATISAKTIGN